MDSFSPRVLVTGGGLGLGYSTVEFLLNKFNARVVVFTLHYGAELEALQQKYLNAKKLWILKGDVTKVGVPGTLSNIP
jgi:NAD(P)-dependent dehydrogenase (short-subunit alcohol dehydrogenase family)